MMANIHRYMYNILHMYLKDNGGRYVANGSIGRRSLCDEDIPDVVVGRGNISGEQFITLTCPRLSQFFVSYIFTYAIKMKNMI